MRKGYFVPMILLSLTLASCGAGQVTQDAASMRVPYQQMDACIMEAKVSCTQYGEPWDAVLRCTYRPDAESTVEVLAPETISGVTVTFDGASRYLNADGRRLNAGRVSPEGLSPSDVLPRLMDALRDGWTVEENPEEWDGVPCVRLTVDQTGQAGSKVFSTVWLKTSDGTPLRAEIAVGDETMFTAEFTSFEFCVTMDVGDSA